MITVTVTGVDKAINRLGMDRTVDLLQAPMMRGLREVQAYMMRYPPQRAGSTYRRTLTLGRKWTVKVERTAHGLRGEVGNNTPYGPFVQSSQYQARVHRGRWQTDTQAVNELGPGIIRDLEQSIRAALAG